MSIRLKANRGNQEAATRRRKSNSGNPTAGMQLEESNWRQAKGSLKQVEERNPTGGNQPEATGGIQDEKPHAPQGMSLTTTGLWFLTETLGAAGLHAPGIPVFWVGEISCFFWCFLFPRVRRSGDCKGTSKKSLCFLFFFGGGAGGSKERLRHKGPPFGWFKGKPATNIYLEELVPNFGKHPYGTKSQSMFAKLSSGAQVRHSVGFWNRILFLSRCQRVSSKLFGRVPERHPLS